MTELRTGTQACRCDRTSHETKLVAITGGPGAGKTAVLEMASRLFCKHVGILPESAGVVFGGGFPRTSSDPAVKAAQRAIFYVQRELETLVLQEATLAVALCDRGTVDGLAYWPGAPEEYFAGVGTTIEAQLARYEAVIHLEVPSPDQGYNHDNVLRIESAREAKQIDDRILDAWAAHPKRFVVKSTPDFFDKAFRCLELIRAQLSPCCRAVD